MISRRQRFWLSMARELGLGYALLFFGMAAYHLNISLKINPAFPPGHLHEQQVFFQLLFFFMMWNAVCGRHLRLVASAAQLQIPSAMRPLSLSLAALALLGGGWFMTSMNLLNEPWRQALAVLVNTMLLVLLQQSSRRYRLALWILVWALLLISMGWLPFSRFVSIPKPGWSVAVVLALLAVWQLRSLNRPAQRDVAGASVLRLLNLPDQTAPASGWWRARSFVLVPRQRRFGESPGQAGSRDLVRAALGPRYRLRSLLSPPMLLSSLLIAAFPWRIAQVMGFFAACGCGTSWADYLARLKPGLILTVGMPSLLLWSLLMFAGVMHLTRLAAVLKRHGGEFVELPLMPGTGDNHARHRMLLHEALLRPLIGYSLWSAALTSSMLLLAAMIHSGWSQYFSLLLPGCAWPLAFAAQGWGLLCGALDPARPWLGKAWIPILFLSIITVSRVVYAASPGWPDSLDVFPLWLSLTWVALLLLLTVCLLRWARAYQRQPNPYCR